MNREPGPVERVVANAAPVHRSQHRAAAIVQAVRRPFTFTRDDIEVRVREVRLKGRLLEVTVEARDERGPLPTSNPYQFLNPPVMVQVGTEQQLVEGGFEEVPVYEENPEAALQEIVFEAVISYARGAGWQS